MAKPPKHKIEPSLMAVSRRVDHAKLTEMFYANPDLRAEFRQHGLIVHNDGFGSPTIFEHSDTDTYLHCVGTNFDEKFHVAERPSRGGRRKGKVLLSTRETYADPRYSKSIRFILEKVAEHEGRVSPSLNKNGE